MRGCTTRWRVNGGAPREQRSPGSRSASGGGDVGHRQLGDLRRAPRRPRRRPARARSALPSCSMRADSVLSERPARSIVACDPHRARLRRARVVDRQRARRALGLGDASRSARAAASPRGSRRAARARRASRARRRPRTARCAGRAVVRCATARTTAVSRSNGRVSVGARARRRASRQPRTRRL